VSIASLPKQSVDAEQTFRYISGRFVKQEGTMGTLASQRETGACVQAPRVATHRGSQLPAPTPDCAGVGAGSCPSRYSSLGYNPGKFEIYMQNTRMECIFGRKMDHFDRPSTTVFWAIQTNLHNRVTDRQAARQMTDRRTDHATHTTFL